MRKAIAFLTPFGGPAVPSPAALSWFPVVGAGLGLTLGTIWWAADRLWAAPVAAAVVVAADLALTGMLHFDGLVDSADGLLPPMDPSRRLDVMADPAAGAFGVGVAVVVVLLRWTSLATLAPSPVLLGALWCASRLAMAQFARTVPYARSAGLATAFLEPGPHRLPVAGLLLGAVLTAFGAGDAVAGVAVLGIGAAAVIALAVRRLGGFTGDVLGAAGMVGETAGLLGEPPSPVHPVVAFGRLMRTVEHGIYRDSRIAGAGHTAVGTGLGVITGGVVGSTAAATWMAVAGRALATAALDVASALDADDLPRARALLPALVGRDPSDLDEKEIARAVVESVAENTVDAVVAPALWAALLGAPGALGYRAVNTLDAMVGHRSVRYRHYGWASARLDDLAGWVPARVTAALVAAVRPRAARSVWIAVRTQAPAHPSPNAGVVEAAFAAALGLRLGGQSRYGERIELRPPLGTGRPAEPGDIARAVALSRDVSTALCALPVVKWAVSAGITTRSAQRGRR